MTASPARYLIVLPAELARELADLGVAIEALGDSYYGPLWLLELRYVLGQYGSPRDGVAWLVRRHTAAALAALYTLGGRPAFAAVVRAEAPARGAAP